MSPSVKKNAIADHARSTAIYGHRPDPGPGDTRERVLLTIGGGGGYLYVSDQLGILTEQPEGEGSSEASIMARRARIKLD